MNIVEKFVYEVCRKSFLSLWSYANPRGKDSKELCDILVVCEPDIIIFSVKEIKVSESGDITTDWERWNRRAIEESCKQIYGAERWIKSASHVIRNDGTLGLDLPSVSDRRIHRIAIAFGSEDKVPMYYGDFGKGFVHVFDETSFNIIIQELDTISDFSAYLIAKEDLYKAGVDIILSGEENLLALYLHKGKKFPTGHTKFSLTDDLWEGFRKKEEYINKKKADEVSYVWDRLIEKFSEDILEGNLEYGNSLTNGEKVFRTLAREDRFARRVLGKSFKEFIKLSGQNIVRSRMVPSPSGIIYVFLALPHGTDRKYRRAVLGTRCFVARGLNKNSSTVVGIATEQYKPGKGFSLDAYYLHMPISEWTERHQSQFKSMQKDLGHFSKPAQRRVQEDEYPIHEKIKKKIKMKIPRKTK